MLHSSVNIKYCNTYGIGLPFNYLNNFHSLVYTVAYAKDAQYLSLEMMYKIRNSS